MSWTCFFRWKVLKTESQVIIPKTLLRTSSKSPIYSHTSAAQSSWSGSMTGKIWGVHAWASLKLTSIVRATGVKITLESTRLKRIVDVPRYVSMSTKVGKRTWPFIWASDTCWRPLVKACDCKPTMHPSLTSMSCMYYSTFNNCGAKRHLVVMPRWLVHKPWVRWPSELQSCVPQRQGCADCPKILLHTDSFDTRYSCVSCLNVFGSTTRNGITLCDGRAESRMYSPTDDLCERARSLSHNTLSSTQR